MAVFQKHIWPWGKMMVIHWIQVELKMSRLFFFELFWSVRFDGPKDMKSISRSIFFKPQGKSHQNKPMVFCEERREASTYGELYSILVLSSASTRFFGVKSATNWQVDRHGMRPNFGVFFRENDVVNPGCADIYIYIHNTLFFLLKSQWNIKQLGNGSFFKDYLLDIGPERHIHFWGKYCDGESPCTKLDSIQITNIYQTCKTTQIINN